MKSKPSEFVQQRRPRIENVTGEGQLRQSLDTLVIVRQGPDMVRHRPEACGRAIASLGCFWTQSEHILVGTLIPPLGNADDSLNNCFLRPLRHAVVSP